jgi:hypothetical protein
MWLEDDPEVPHGIFKKPENIRYIGGPSDGVAYPEEMIDMIIEIQTR